jgi:hypothetical protein
VLRDIPPPALYQSTSISRLEARWGITTNVIWIDNPDGRVRELFPSEYVGKIRSITYGGKAANIFRYATVRFDTIEDALFLIQTLSHRPINLVLKTAVRRDLQGRVGNRAISVLLGMYYGYLVVGVCISICQCVLTIMPEIQTMPQEKE